MSRGNHCRASFATTMLTDFELLQLSLEAMGMRLGIEEQYGGGVRTIVNKRQHTDLTHTFRDQKGKSP